MTNKIMWRGIGALLLMLLLLSSNVCAQTDTLLYPLKNVPLLSGNFGELRATHLHSGLDFKTGGGNNHGVWSFKPFCTPNCESREKYTI